MNILYLPNEYAQQRQKEKPADIYPIIMAMEATYQRNQGHNVVWDIHGDEHKFDHIVCQYEGIIDFLNLPPADRILTMAKDQKWQENGNFKYHPGTYIQSALDCYWAKCTFCQWAKKFPICKTRPVESVIDEIKYCKRLGFKEIFDDSGTFPKGAWRDEFINRITRSISKGIKIGCNLRIEDYDYSSMYNANFRMVLFGLESANQKTLDKINKGTKVEDFKYIIKAAKAGLECHAAVMFGYPWETDIEAQNTLRLVHELLIKGHIKTAQASLYDTKEGCNPDQHHFVKDIYSVARHPAFWLTKIRDIKNIDDIKYLWKGIKRGMSAYFNNSSS